MSTKINKLDSNQSPGLATLVPHRMAKENGKQAASAMDMNTSTSTNPLLHKGHQQISHPSSPTTSTNTQQERDVLAKLPRMERIPAALYRWNTNEEIAAWLYSAQQHAEWFTLDVRIRPPNGSILLYHKKGSNYKHDGYVWKKRKDGKLPREDHMRLKVKGVEIIYANYVHSALVPTFHRRSYWLLSYPDVVLVHYLNTPGEGELVERIIPSLRVSVTQYTRCELLEQLKPMLCNGPLTFDDQNQGTILNVESKGPQGEVNYEERLRFVNALIDQARQSRTVPTGTPTPNQQPDLGQLGNVPTAATSTPKTPQALVLTSVGGQLLFAIDAQSPAGTALLAAQQQHRPQATFQAPVPPLDSGQEAKSSSSTSSGSPPLAQQSSGPFVAPVVINPQQQISRVLNGIRSNSCSSASRRVMCSTIMRRQPSAFSDGADDVFRPLSEAVLAASSSCSTAEVGGPLAPPAHNDSAYCSFADAKDEENHGLERPRRHLRDQDTKADESGGQIPVEGTSQKGGDPMLQSVGDSVNLGLSQEDIAKTLRANLAAMIDKPSMELFRAMPSSGRPEEGNVDDRRVLNGDGGSPMDEGCSNFIPSSHLLSSPDSSFRLLNQILSGEDYGDEEEVDEHSMKSVNCQMDQESDRKQSDSSSYFQPNEGPAQSNMGMRGGTRLGTGSAGSRAASCGSSQGSAGSNIMTGLRFTDSTSVIAGVDDFNNSATTGMATGVQTIQDEHRQRQGTGGRNAVATITDFSPDWSYTQGGTKILISGPWYSTSHRYNCLFGDISVPACLIQTGVLRCYCPPHEPGNVSLIVCCDEQVISNSVMFEYRSNPQDSSITFGASSGRRWAEIAPDFWIGANENHFCMGLLERLETLEKNLVGSSSDASTIGNKSLETAAKETASMVSMQELEERLIRVCRTMASKEWKPVTSPCTPALAHHCGMTLIHFAASLGFARLILILYEWFRRGRGPRLESELQFTKQDMNGRTALMWACVRGKIEVANLLARGCRDSLFISDWVRLGELPLAVAFRDGHVELVREVVQHFVAENGGDPDARDLDTALWVLTSGLVERSQLFYYNKRPYIHARRHQCPSQARENETGDFDQRRHQLLNGVTSAQPNLRLRKQLSLDSQMIKAPLSMAANMGGHNQKRQQLEGKKSARERAKRASVEGLEELIRNTAELPTGPSYRHYSESGGQGHRASATSDVGMTLSSKITRQDSENSSSVTSYMSVEEWLKQPLSVEIPMDITVPDSPTASDMWETVANSTAEPGDNDGMRAQMATLAQQIIDALPDRIKQETFLEEEYEGADQQMQQQQQQQYPGYFQDGHSSEMTMGTQQYVPHVTVADRGDFVSYRHYDAPTPCSSSLSPSSARSPSIITPSMCTEMIMATDPSKSGSYKGQPLNLEQQHSIPISPGNFLTTSPASSSAGVQSRNVFLFPSPNNCSTYTDHSGPMQQGCPGLGRCCQQQQSAMTVAEATNLGEFFNAARSRSPLECHFQELTLTDREQRQLYEAAKVIQNAYRQYRQRMQTQNYSHMERQAAVVIQTCYRRYRQYCYFKKLHQAAVLIQKHFRLYKAAKRSKTNPGTNTSTSDGRRPSANADVSQEENLTGFTQFLENAVQQAIGNKDTTVLMTAQSTTPGNINQAKSQSKSCIRIQVTPEELMRWKQHLAAMRIQHAFRGHRKRQDAAARKIQKFMREARQKLAKARTDTEGPESAIEDINNDVNNVEGVQLEQQPHQQRFPSLIQHRQQQTQILGQEAISRPGCQCMQISSIRK